PADAGPETAAVRTAAAAASAAWSHGLRGPRGAVRSSAVCRRIAAAARIGARSWREGGEPQPGNKEGAGSGEQGAGAAFNHLHSFRSNPNSVAMVSSASG